MHNVLGLSSHAIYFGEDMPRVCFIPLMMINSLVTKLCLDILQHENVTYNMISGFFMIASRTQSSNF
jgi:hypothetical protein